MGKLMLRHNFLKNIVAYGVSNGLAAVSPLLLLPILTRVFTPNELGQYSMYLMVYAIFTIFLGLNQHGAITVSYHKMNSSDFIELLKAATILPLLCFVLLLMLCFVFVDVVVVYVKLDAYYTYLAVSAALFNVYLLLFLSVLQTSNNPLKYLGGKLVHTISDILFTLFFLLILYLGITGRIFAFNIALIFSAILGGYFVFKIGFSFSYKNSLFKKDFVKKIIIYGVPLIPHTIAGVMLMYIDRVMLANVVGLDSVGIYLAALQVSMIFLIIIEPVNKAYAPWLFSKLSKVSDFEKSRIVKMTYMYFVILFTLSFFLTLVSKFFYYDFVGQAFSQGINLLPIMFLGFAFQGMYYSVTNYILFSERTGVLSIISGTVAIIGSIFSYLLTYKFEMIGAAYSFMITNLLLFLSVWFFSNKLFPMPWFSFFSVRSQS